jgi:hypothetical protein
MDQAPPTDTDTATTEAPSEHATTALLPIAAGTPVNVQRTGSSLRVRAEVLGTVPGAYIALRGADHRSELRSLSALSLRVGDSIIIRFIHEGVVCGFRTAVTRLSADPEPLVFVHYPRRVEQVSVRREPRMSCRMPCLVVAADAEPRPGLMLDVSATGCGIVGEALPDRESPGVGTPVTVTIALPERSEANRATGEIRRLSHRDGNWVIGVLFGSEQQDLHTALARYLALDTGR